MVVSLAAAAEAPYVRAAKPIKDDQGRNRVIVDFDDKAHLSYPGKLPILPEKSSTRQVEPVVFFHTEKTLALVADFEKRYGFKRLGITSWVGNSVTAALNPEVIEQLRKDPLVRQISDDEYEALSATPPPWSYSSSGNEWTSWGHHAVNGKVATVNTGRKIYIIDAGVAFHDDLPPMTRLNVACGSGTNCNSMSPGQYPLVGCYGHATHVAGIIGAISGNNKSMRGAYAGFPNMVSLAISVREPAISDDCGNKIASGAIGNALDYIAFDTTQNNPQRLVNIVNMSINPGGVQYVNYQQPQPNWPKVKAITNTIWAYGIPIQPGVLFVQSAGNVSDVPQGCGSVFRPDYGVNALPDDGVLVVGATHHTGEAVRPGALFNATSPAGLTADAGYSNYGGCVDVWAVGNLVLSTWGNNDVATAPLHPDGNRMFTEGTIHSITNSYSGDFPGSTTGWAFLSGTSMAAPFVAAGAAWLADTFGYTTAGELEIAIRNNICQFNGNVDGDNLPVKVFQLPNAPASAISCP